MKEKLTGTEIAAFLGATLLSIYETRENGLTFFASILEESLLTSPDLLPETLADVEMRLDKITRPAIATATPFDQVLFHRFAELRHHAEEDPTATIARLRSAVLGYYLGLSAADRKLRRNAIINLIRNTWLS